MKHWKPSCMSVQAKIVGCPLIIACNAVLHYKINEEFL